jgi:hypothetical protein
VASAVAGCPAPPAGKPSGEDEPAIALGLNEHSVNTRRNKRRGMLLSLELTESPRDAQGLLTTAGPSVSAGPSEVPGLASDLLDPETARPHGLSDRFGHRLMVDPEKVLDAMCGEPRSTALACR